MHGLTAATLWYARRRPHSASSCGGLKRVLILGGSEDAQQNKHRKRRDHEEVLKENRSGSAITP